MSSWEAKRAEFQNWMAEGMPMGTLRAWEREAAAYVKSFEKIDDGPMPKHLFPDPLAFCGRREVTDEEILFERRRGSSYKAIGEKFGISRSTVAGVIYRASLTKI